MKIHGYSAYQKTVLSVLYVLGVEYSTPGTHVRCSEIVVWIKMTDMKTDDIRMGVLQV